MINQHYNNYCRKCRNNKFWSSLFNWRVRHLLAEKKDGKRITIRLSRTIESKLSGNISEIVLRNLALEVAKQMTIYDDKLLKGLK